MKKEVLADGVELYLGDCREILPQISGFAAVVADPPYGQDYMSGWATDELWAAGRTITNDHSTAARDEMLSLINVPALVFGSRKIPEPGATRMILTWDKGAALGMGALDLPWKPSSEEIYVIGKGFDGPRDESNVLYCPPVQSMAKNGRLHPNEKPVALLQRLIRKCPLGTILDPFMGSGSTGVAAVKMGRKFVGIEIETKYFDIACRRVRDALARPDLFIDAPKLVESTQLDLGVMCAEDNP
jgi:DNA modification methylase